MFARAVLCLILLRPRSPFTKISRRLSEIGWSELLLIRLTLIALDKSSVKFALKNTKLHVHATISLFKLKNSLNKKKSV